MNRVPGLAAIGALLAWAVSTGPVAAATRRLFSYDPADDATRHAAGALTFEFDQHLMSTTVIAIKATEGEASAALRPVGAGLYAVLPADQGPQMIAAFCPGSKQAWMAIPRLRANHDIRVQVVGDGPSGAPRHACRTLSFSYHGEWKLPPGPGIDPRTIRTPRFPY